MVAIWGALPRVLPRLMQTAIWHFPKIKNLQNLLNQYEAINWGYILLLPPHLEIPQK